MEVIGSTEGGWSIRNVRAYALEYAVDVNGFVKAWTVEAEVSCTPGASSDRCDVRVRVWMKQKAIVSAMAQ